MTAADIFLEGAIREWLDRDIPSICFIGEERWIAGAAVGDGWMAVLDPIDGTGNFCSGLEERGMSLPIRRGGRNEGSMLMMPQLGEAMTTGAVPFMPRSRIVAFSSSCTEAIGWGVSRDRRRPDAMSKSTMRIAMDDFSSQVGAIASTYATDTIFILGKGPPIDAIPT